MIYALINLFEGHVTHSLVADYDKTLQALYVDLLFNIVALYNNLNILSFLGKEAVLSEREKAGRLELQELEEKVVQLLRQIDLWQLAGFLHEQKERFGVVDQTW